MLVPKKNRVAIYTQLFQDGVMTAKKDPFQQKHHELPVPNLHVMKLLQSLVTRQYVSETYSWRWYYWKLTDAGIEFLREFLHLSAEVVPNTHKRPLKPAAPLPSRSTGERGPRRFDREEYRGPKDGSAPGDFQPQFAGEEGQARPQRFGRGGFGRGARGGRGGFGARAEADRE